MNGFKPSIGIKFDDKYIDASTKLVDFVEALIKLTDSQRQQLANDFILSVGMVASFEQFVKYMDNGGQV